MPRFPRRPRTWKAPLLLACLAASPGCHPPSATPSNPLKPALTLAFDSPTNPEAQAWLEEVDRKVRSDLGMSSDDTAAGMLDLLTGRLALVRPDRIEYAASVAKIGILLAWFDLHPGAAQSLPPDTAAALGQMVKTSSNTMAARFTRSMGLKAVQAVLVRHGFYDAERGGGLWVGRHYGGSEERYGDPVADHSHAATVRQVLRFFQMMEQDQLLSPAVSAVMRGIFDSPALPHDDIKFVKFLAPRGLHLRRKWGTWEDWKHDAAAVTGPGRHYLLVALTRHPRGDQYLEKLAVAVDDYLVPAGK
jgi:beta-lactamase class A